MGLVIARRLSVCGLLAVLAGTTGCHAAGTYVGGQTGGAAAPVTAGATAGRVGFVQFPSLSPDGKTMVFSWLGDLWTAPVDDTSLAVRLTSHPAEERRSVFSPDGSMLAFESDRDGGRNLFVVQLGREGGKLTAGPVRRVTAVDRPLSLSGWTPDGRGLVFSAGLEPAVYRGTRMFTVSLPASDGVFAPIQRIDGPVGQAWGSQPRISPDGKLITFTRGRADWTRPRYVGSGSAEVWTFDTGTQAFMRLASDPHPDGDAFPIGGGRVVFLSSRGGATNVYMAEGGSAKPLTRFAPPAASASGGGPTVGYGVRDLAVSPSGNAAVFVVWDAVYRLDLPGGEPKAINLTAASGDGTELDTQRLNLSREVSEAAVSPDGKTLAVVARGEVFVRSTDEGHPTRRVTFTPGRERGLAWSPDGRVLWFSSDEGGRSEIYYATVAMSREDLGIKKPEDKKAEEKKPEEAKADDGAKAEAKPEGGKEEPAAEDKPGEGARGRGAAGAARPSRPAGPDFGKRWQESIRYNVTKLEGISIPAGPNDGVLGMELRSPEPSPDGKKLLVTRGLGDLVLIDLVNKSARVVLEGWNEPGVQWAADSRHIVYEREDEDFNSDIWLMDTQPGADGKVSPGVNLTRHPDNDTSPRLSVDGKVLYFRSERARENDEAQVFAVYLDRKLEGLRPYELDEHFKKATEAVKRRKPIDPVIWDAPPPAGKAEAAADAKAAEPKAAEAKAEEPKAEGGEGAKAEPAERRTTRAAEPLKFDADDAWERVRRVGNIQGSVGSILITPAGDRVLYVASSDSPGSGPATPPGTPPATPPAPGGAGGGEGVATLFSMSYKGDDRRVVTSGAVGGAAMNLTGDRVSFVRSGGAQAVSLAGGRSDSYPIDAPVILDIAKQQRQKFIEVARVLGNGFYHPTLKGLNWAALTEGYLNLVQTTRTNDEFDRVAMMLLGELNGSHLGVTGSGSFSAPSMATGYLGVDAGKVADGWRIKRVYEDGPAWRPSSELKVGDVLLAVDGQKLAGMDLLAAFAGKAGKETLIEVRRDGVEKPFGMLITPTSGGEDGELRYRAEIASRKAKVEELSGGKLGYLHIRAMSEPSVREFERDLYAAAHGKQGLVIDVRDNGGGSTADILLASLTAPNHAFTANRGVDPGSVKRDAYPRDRRLIYGYTRPIVLLINENSFSNAEIFAHAIKTIGRGKLVGTATFGGVISTGGTTLIDGTSVRTPFRGWYLPDGTDMENNGAKPDIDVPQVPQDEAAGRDAQLEAAVRSLLGK